MLNHESDCAVHNMPSEPNGPCDCRLKKGEELIEAAKPLLDFINKYYHPYAYALVTEGRVEIFEMDMSAPLPVRD